MSSEEEAVAWLRRAIEARRALARGTVELGNNVKWVEQSSGVLVTGEGSDTDVWDGTWPMGDSTLTRLMEANDPQDTFARCEAELAILDEHVATDWTAYGDRMCRRCRWEEGEINRDTDNDTSWVTFPCRTICLLASAYRHREGYAEHWGVRVIP